MSLPARRPRLRRLGAVAFALCWLVACFDSREVPPPSPDEPYLGPRSGCSNGPAYAADARFPTGPRESGQPVCVERCGTHPQVKWGPTNVSSSFDGVPSGSCAYEGEACSMVAATPCCGTDQGAAFLFDCRCVAAVWTCRSHPHAGTSCSCAEAGAAADDGG